MEDCYYFSKEWKTWKESKAQCSALESRLLKTESKAELVNMIFFSLSLTIHPAFCQGLNSHSILPRVQYATARVDRTKWQSLWRFLWSPSPYTVVTPPWGISAGFRGVNRGMSALGYVWILIPPQGKYNQAATSWQIFCCFAGTNYLEVIRSPDFSFLVSTTRKLAGLACSLASSATCPAEDPYLFLTPML